MKTACLKKKIQIVTIAENKVLFLQFAKLYNNGFQNITGSVEEGESFQEAAVRELEEEIGIKKSVIDINFDFFFHDQWGADVHEKIFLCLLDKIPKIVLSHEHIGFKWIDIHKIILVDYVFHTNFESLQKALEYMNQ